MTEHLRPTQMDDPYDLQRFLDAQDSIDPPLRATERGQGVRSGQVQGELRSGRKATHWMWFVFPQIAGLGYSSMAKRYAIGSRAEAAAYADHPVLGARLRESTALVNALEGHTVSSIFGSPDDLKFHSSMTLFSLCATDPRVFQDALDKYFNGEADPMTVARL